MKLTKDNRPAVKVNRTLEGTIFEIAVAAILIISWVYLIVNIDKLASSFPFSQCVVTSAVALCMMAAAYFPNSINMPVRIETPRQYSLAIRMIRIVGVILSLMPAAMVISDDIVLHIVLISSMFIVIIIFGVLIYRAKG